MNTTTGQSVASVVSALLDNRWRHARTQEEVEALVDDLVRASLPHWGTQLYLADQPVDRYSDPSTRLVVSVDPDQGAGALSYHDYRPDGGAWDSLAATTSPGAPALVYDPHGGSRYRPSSTLPLAQVEQAVREFLTDGERPSCLSWQDAEVV
ncbi:MULTISPECIES: Imm1 family immunity protein [Actinosynnema]|uniref:Imm1 family immunity protein n=1 Tax=Actinosynnema TaxID=40566 RepID=UPI0020A6030F|nr:Imm1 family immunity protein [Actinosynnema pretiosum]MCP2094717.1 Immunity protein Imm1 [Actinosynnema pretiosum]